MNVVTVQQATYLKKYGFNEKCFYYYENDKLKTFDKQITYDDDIITLHDVEDSINQNNYLNCFDAPTLNQTHEWIISKGYYIHVYPGIFGYKTFYTKWCVEIIDIKFPNNKETILTTFDTYPQALSEGITIFLTKIAKYNESKSN